MRAVGLVLLLIAAAAAGQQLPKYDKAKLGKPRYYFAVQWINWIDDWKPFAQPPEYAETKKAMEQALDAGEWVIATEKACFIRDMIPAKTPDDWPWHYDTQATVQAGIGELMVIRGKYFEAERMFEMILGEVPKRYDAQARAHASHGLARIHSLMLNIPEWRKQSEQAVKEYESGCANCAEAGAIGAHITNLVQEAVQQKSARAVTDLIKLIHGDFKQFVTHLSDQDREHQKRGARIMASFYLGLIYEREGKKERAREAFEFCVAAANEGGGSLEAVIAWQKLRWMDPQLRYGDEITVDWREKLMDLGAYFVDRDGFVDVPSMGRVKVGGLTEAEAAASIRNLLDTKRVRRKATIVVRRVGG